MRSIEDRTYYTYYLIQFQVGLKNVNKKPGGANPKPAFCYLCEQWQHHNFPILHVTKGKKRVLKEVRKIPSEMQSFLAITWTHTCKKCGPKVIFEQFSTPFPTRTQTDAAAPETFCEKEAIFVSIYCPEQNFESVLITKRVYGQKWKWRGIDPSIVFIWFFFYLS